MGIVGTVVTAAIGLGALCAAFWAVERFWPALPARPRQKGTLLSDVLYGGLTMVSGRAAVYVAVGIAAVIVGATAGQWTHLFRSGLDAIMRHQNGVVGRQSLWLQTMEILLWLELSHYWAHRWFHSNPWAWRFHAVHHSSEWVDWLTAVRVHPVNDLLMQVLEFVPLLALGYNLVIVAAIAPVLKVHDILLHANVPWGFGPLRYVIATPVFHRWHHTSEEQGLRKNLSGLFVWPDLLFGTYYVPKERQPRRFGIDGEAVPQDFLGSLAWGLSGRPIAGTPVQGTQAIDESNVRVAGP